MAKKKTKRKPLSRKELELYEYLVGIRWGSSIKCLYCGKESTTEIDRKGYPPIIQCRECRKQFTVRKNSLFEDGRTSLEATMQLIQRLSSPLESNKPFLNQDHPILLPALKSSRSRVRFLVRLRLLWSRYVTFRFTGKLKFEGDILLYRERQPRIGKGRNITLLLLGEFDRAKMKLSERNCLIFILERAQIDELNIQQFIQKGSNVFSNETLGLNVTNIRLHPARENEAQLAREVLKDFSSSVDPRIKKSNLNGYVAEYVFRKATSLMSWEAYKDHLIRLSFSI